ncbi:hypothetical protein VP01_707g2 [Puccinia sorghi]|uniref:Uncharacterized protein n=1 Tax=Puccinia sorghi TaxID=27349 RepID=A0A0L6UEH4_9BASI|nr:hypothetical protein VP01_707g2 [Puccinia sorghi]
MYPCARGCHRRIFGLKLRRLPIVVLILTAQLRVRLTLTSYQTSLQTNVTQVPSCGRGPKGPADCVTQRDFDELALPVPGNLMRERIEGVPGFCAKSIRIGAVKSPGVSPTGGIIFSLRTFVHSPVSNLSSQSQQMRMKTKQDLETGEETAKRTPGDDEMSEDKQGDSGKREMRRKEIQVSGIPEDPDHLGFLLSSIRVQNLKMCQIHCAVGEKALGNLASLLQFLKQVPNLEGSTNYRWELFTYPERQPVPHPPSSGRCSGTVTSVYTDINTWFDNSCRKIVVTTAPCWDFLHVKLNKFFCGIAKYTPGQKQRQHVHIAFLGTKGPLFKQVCVQIAFTLVLVLNTSYARLLLMSETNKKYPMRRIFRKGCNIFWINNNTVENKLYRKGQDFLIDDSIENHTMGGRYNCGFSWLAYSEHSRSQCEHDTLHYFNNEMNYIKEIARLLCVKIILSIEILLNEWEAKPCSKKNNLKVFCSISFSTKLTVRHKFFPANKQIRATLHCNLQLFERCGNWTHILKKFQPGLVGCNISLPCSWSFLFSTLTPLVPSSPCYPQPTKKTNNWLPSKLPSSPTTTHLTVSYPSSPLRHLLPSPQLPSNQRNIGYPSPPTTHPPGHKIASLLLLDHPPLPATLIPSCA